MQSRDPVGHDHAATSRLWYEISVLPQFLGSGRECFMRINVRMFNPGINSVRLDALTVTSHTPDWSGEIDRLEYRPNPGGTMAPRSGQDMRLNGILLKANGNQSAWSYRWALNWAYTFWRPSAAAFPLAAGLAQAEPASQQATGRTVRGGADLRRIASPAEESRQGTMPANGSQALTRGDGAQGDTIAIDRLSKSITIVIR